MVELRSYNFVVIYDVIWTWDPVKAAANAVKHGISIRVAARVFEDPMQLSVPEPHTDDDRWRTLGRIAEALVLVVHTAPAPEFGEELPVGRIISARRATVRERRIYEEGVH